MIVIVFISIVPYQAFKTKDGHIVIGALNDDQFERLCECLNLNQLPNDPRFKLNAGRDTYMKHNMNVPGLLYIIENCYH